MNYKHFNQIERDHIACLMKAQHSIMQIASLIGREPRRNAGSRGYRPKQASEQAIERSRTSCTAPTAASWVKEQANGLLRLQWSPAQVASRLRVSQETLYQHVCADKIQGGSLWKNLRSQQQKRKRYASRRARRGAVPNRSPFGERPAYIEGCKQVGHWECVIGCNHNQAITTVFERKSGYAHVAKVSNKTADLVGHAIIKALTYDNRKEFCGHAQIDQALGSTGYFARPVASWGRGSNENFNGLLRQYVPTKRAMANITDEEIRMTEPG